MATTKRVVKKKSSRHGKRVESAKRAAPHQHAKAPVVDPLKRPTGPPTQMVSMKELSRHLQVSRNTLRKLVQSGRVPYYRVGNQYRFDVLAVRNALSNFV